MTYILWLLEVLAVQTSDPQTAQQLNIIVHLLAAMFGLEIPEI